MNLLRAVADLAMPRECLGCGDELEAGQEYLCSACLEDLPKTRYWLLRENPMSESFNSLIQRGMGDDVRYVPYGYAAALYFYRGGYREISKALKYRRNFAAGEYFARMLGETLAQSEWFRSVGLVVPVPLHWSRRWSRGYNQAEVIAREVARCLGVPLGKGLLVRRRHTGTQTHLGLEDRARNVAGAFRLTRKGRAMIASASRPGHILLIDDVYTTGATAAACSAAFRYQTDCRQPHRSGSGLRPSSLPSCGWAPPSDIAEGGMPPDGECLQSSPPGLAAPPRVSVATLACVER